MSTLRVRTKLAWAGTLLVIVLCLWPKGWLPRKEEPPDLIPHADKLVHFGMFAVFGALWMLEASPDRRRSRAVGVLAGGLVLAVGTELAQALPVVNRDPDVLDGLADLVGVVTPVMWLLRAEPSPSRTRTPVSVGEHSLS